MIENGFVGVRDVRRASTFERFVIVADQPYTQRNIDRFGATWLRERGKTVQLLDVSRLTWGTAAGAGAARDDVVTPGRWSEVGDVLRSDHERPLVIVYAEPSEALRPLFDMMQRCSAPSLYYDGGRIPVMPHRWLSLRRAAGPLVGTARRWLRRLRHGAPFTADLDYYLMGGTDCEENPPAWLRAAHTKVPAYSCDYAVWLTASSFVHDAPYVVFLDQAYPHHPDPEKILKIRTPFKPEVYYPQVEGFLERLREALGLPVLVSLHPRSPEAPLDRRYRGFPTFRGQTASLVKGASLVVTHDSTALSFAVLDRKPILLVKVDEIDQLLARSVIHNLSSALGAPMVHVTSRPARTIPQVHEEKYARYETKYVRHPLSKDGPLWEQFVGGGAS